MRTREQRILTVAALVWIAVQIVVGIVLVGGVYVS